MQADWIAIGTVGNVVQINSIDYATNTITLASPMTWSDNASVWLYKKSDGTRVLYSTAPEMGAHEYLDDIYYDLTITKPTLGTITSNVGTINCGSGGDMGQWSY